jgi:hypothetical protein
VKDISLEAYVEGIEHHLRARRGTEHVLSPRDFGIARAWHEAAVPLATVLVGIDRAFETGDVTSLSYCRRRVEELVASGPRPVARPPPPAESVPLKDVEVILEALCEKLMALSPAPRASFEPPLRKIREIQDLVSVSSRPNWEYLRSKLKEIDDDVSAAVLQALPPEEVATLRAEATRTVERLRGRVDDDSLEDALTRYTIQRGRERLQLPRVSLV